MGRGAKELKGQLSGTGRNHLVEGGEYVKRRGVRGKGITPPSDLNGISVTGPRGEKNGESGSLLLDKRVTAQSQKASLKEQKKQNLVWKIKPAKAATVGRWGGLLEK